MSHLSYRLRQRVLWTQVWGLATVQGAITLSWVIYSLYLVEVLTQLGFSPALATGLLVLENGLAIVMEPLMGSLSDRVQQWLGNRFLLIALGMILAASLFLSIPLVMLGNGEAVRWLVPTAMVAWALSMTVFRSPALSLLGRYALATKLPQAASVLTLVGGITGAMGFLVSDWLLALGPLSAFGIGSAVLLGAAVVLGLCHPARAVVVAPTSRWRDLSLEGLSLVFGAGLGVSLGGRLMIQTFPRALAAQDPTVNASIILGLLFIVLALTAIPAGSLAIRIGNRSAMILGLVGMALLCLTIGGLTSMVLAGIVAIALGALFSLVSNGTLPFALSLVPYDRGGLGTGLYFSGGALALSLFGTLSRLGDSLSPVQGGQLAASAFGFAALCVGGSMWVRK
ncbi:putative major facilitator transporter [Halomicronema hongdechloris C2206]|uniref:Major facilitator transporter n=1 Tax=Halomicronema hongdechloris C2206 TaxID=1641165 RepID=A0A1Z3HPF7_9CYAN|nr:MFS transporter [Halomicronema hongdechloris]ASC72180.1 putative major facilitator transporter [Halomicronema hongdechloris C2206]